jgi:uncharacterized metal-binding protein
MSERVCLQPCLGGTSAAATVGRQATYAALEELGRKKADLGCAPALFADVPEDVIFIQQDHVIAIESCDKLCANHLVTQKGLPVHATVRVDEILEQAGVDCATLPLETIELDHAAVVVVRDEIVRVAKALLGAAEGAA